MKILVVDDDDLIRELMINTLKGAGYDVEDCSDGADALARLESETYDVVVTDVVMPNQSGVSVGEYIKKNKLPTAVLAVSAYSDQDDGGNALGFANYFADDTLSKPFEKAQLLDAVKSLAGGTDVESALKNL